MLWLLLTIPAGAAVLCWACCAAGARADDASDVVFGDVANLPRGLIRARLAQYGTEGIHSFHNEPKGREDHAA